MLLSIEEMYLIIEVAVTIGILIFGVYLFVFLIYLLHGIKEIFLEIYKMDRKIKQLIDFIKKYYKKVNK